MTDIDRLKQDIVFSATLRGQPLVFHSTWGLFSPRGIDAGTRLLLERIEVGAEDTTLDLGCGYGPIGIAVARCSPAGVVHLADKDVVAAAYARKNVKANGLANCQVHLSNAFDAVPDVAFDQVLANLPANVGAEMLTIILRDAKARLKPGGRLCVVTVNGLRKFIRRNFEETFGNYAKLKQGPHHTVALAVREA